MTVNRLGSRQDQKVNVKVVLGGLWISMLFVFAYVDIFGFWRSDVLRGVLDGQVSGTGVHIDQSFLALTTLYIVVPSLMVPFSLIAPVRINRPINMIVSVVFAASVVAAAIGETWVYYIVGGVVEVLLLLTIAGVAWYWPSSSTPIEPAVPAEPERTQPTDMSNDRRPSQR